MSQAQLSFVYPFSQHNKKSQQNLSVFVVGTVVVEKSQRLILKRKSQHSSLNSCACSLFSDFTWPVIAMTSRRTMFSYFIFSLVWVGIYALPHKSGEYVNPITSTSTKSNCYEVEELVHVDRCETYMNREVRQFF